MRKGSLVPILVSAIVPASLLLAAAAPPAGGAARVEAERTVIARSFCSSWGGPSC